MVKIANLTPNLIALALMFLFIFANTATAQTNQTLNQTLNQTTNSTSISHRAINLPFFGEITIAGGVVSVVMFILGWIIGQSIKSGIKYGLILLILIFILYVFGFISHDILVKIFAGVRELKGFASQMQNNLGMGSGALSLQMATFFAGLMFGLIKG